MHTEGEEVHVSETEASGGSKEGVVRWVLIIGTLLAILLLSAIWIFGAASQGDAEEEATVSGRIEAAEDGTGTDSIVGTDATDLGDDTQPTEGIETAEEDGLEVIEN